MFRMILFSLLAAAFSIAGSPAHAQTPDTETPANEGVCDGLLGATPGLYGLCVGFCEAQDCEADYDQATGEVTFDASCRPSSSSLPARSTSCSNGLEALWSAWAT